MKSLLERTKAFFAILGPGLITGAADDDPSGISTYSVAGATTGLSTLWLALLSTPMMAVVQGMCARLTLVTGRELSALMRSYLPTWVAYTLAIAVIGANTINIGADVAGMAAAGALFVHVPVWTLVVGFGALTLAMQVYLSYAKMARVIKWLTLTLFAYVITAFIVHANWLDVFKHLVVPEVRFNASWFAVAVGLLGTTITPYLFFWQSALELEEAKERGETTVKQRRGTDEHQLADAHADVNAGMIFSNVVAVFIIVTTAVMLGGHGGHIASAQDAAEALRPLAGNFAYALFALGMVGTGLLAIPALSGSSAYLAAGTFQFREGLDKRPRAARKFYAVLVGGVVVGVGLTFLGINPIDALFWSAIVNGIAAVPLIAAIVWLASNRKIMGKWVSSPLARVWGWFCVAIMGVAAVAFAVTSFHK
ncbi:MAG: divalent metal cation transporter [Candidatus Eremiobacteraeota bacterium]|nr:divalent metal cation transporter [Candidatus Eremiobacteraeota bacterium]